MIFRSDPVLRPKFGFAAVSLSGRRGKKRNFVDASDVRRQQGRSFRVIVFLRFHDAGIHPEESLPTQAVVELSVIRALAGAVGSEFRPQNPEHRFSAFVRRPRAFFRQAVDGARLLVVLQHRPSKKKAEVDNQNFSESSGTGILFRVPAFPVFPTGFGEDVASRHLPFHPLSAQRVQLFLSHQTFVPFVVAFPEAKERKTDVSGNESRNRTGDLLAQTKSDFHAPLETDGPVKILKSFHARTSMTSGRVASGQNRLERNPAVGILLAARECDVTSGTQAERFV